MGVEEATHPTVYKEHTLSTVLCPQGFTVVFSPYRWLDGWGTTPTRFVQ